MTDQPVLPGPPQEPQLPEDDPRTQLVQRVRSALMVLPGFFEFGTHFEGIDATDLFSLNSVLGASIEGQVVRTLNKMRNEWDPDEQWTGYRFVRQAQTFPDVLLARQGVGTFDIAMGIELKGWYLLSKEGVGSFRFQVTPAACSIFDLIMIVPWRLSNIMSGTPIASEPWVVSALYAAELRNYWWQHVRQTKQPRGIVHPADVHVGVSASDPGTDLASSDWEAAIPHLRLASSPVRVRSAECFASRRASLTRPPSASARPSPTSMTAASNSWSLISCAPQTDRYSPPGTGSTIERRNLDCHRTFATGDDLTVCQPTSLKGDGRHGDHEAAGSTVRRTPGGRRRLVCRPRLD